MNISILCVSEHWLKNEQVRSVILHNYRAVSVFCRSDFLHGGVGIYVRKDCKNAKEKRSDIIIEKVFEVTGILYDNLAALYVYRAQCGNIDNFCGKLEECTKKISLKNVFCYMW